jgi:hypothetical protein
MITLSGVGIAFSDGVCAIALVAAISAPASAAIATHPAFSRAIRRLPF